MRWVLAMLALTGCDVLFRVDAVAPSDANANLDGSNRGDGDGGIQWLQGTSVNCTNNAGTACAMVLQSLAAGDAVIVTATYDSTSISQLTSVIDDAGGTYRLAAGPMSWKGNPLRTECWVGTAGNGATTVVATWPAGMTPSSLFLAYVDEYTPAMLDHASISPGQQASAVLTSDPVTTANADELLFGHAEAANSVEGGTNFQVRQSTYGNIEEDQPTGAPGAYSASFSLPSSGDAMVVALTLK